MIDTEKKYLRWSVAGDTVIRVSYTDDPDSETYISYEGPGKSEELTVLAPDLGALHRLIGAAVEEKRAATERNAHG